MMVLEFLQQLWISSVKRSALLVSAGGVLRRRAAGAALKHLLVPLVQFETDQLSWKTSDLLHLQSDQMK